ncbi:hypothetical protein EW146_g10181, partial [Bondarzewia mesenterica]
DAATPTAVDVHAPELNTAEDSSKDQPSVVEDDLDDLQLAYPETFADTEEQADVLIVNSLRVRVRDDEDADADGELDPDYGSPPGHVEESESDILKSMSNDSKVALSPTDNVEPTTETTPSLVKSANVNPLLENHAQESDEFYSIPKAVQEGNVEASNHLAPLDEGEHLSQPSTEALDYEDEKKIQSSPSISLIPRKTRSETTEVDQNAKAAVDKKGRGKAKAEDGGIDRDTNDLTSENGSEISSARSAYRLVPAAGNSSRGGSIDSTASTSNSVIHQAQIKGRPHIQLVLPPIVHTHSHGFIHHHHGRAAPPPPPAAVIVPITERNPTSVSRSVSAEVSPYSEPATSQPQRTSSKRSAPTLSSPVTRSNCRFHRISLPQERGLRVSFVVPGCSLGDGDLMKEQAIEDHGLATQDDHARMMPDIESLNLNSYLVGVLRQLVGVDLLREQEVFYLPIPGDRVRKGRHRMSLAEKPKWSQRQSISSAGLRNPGSPISHRSRTPSMIPRLSRSTGDSASTAGSSARGKRVPSKLSAGSTVSADDTELSDDDALSREAPRPKRRKPSPFDEDSAPSASAPLPRKISFLPDAGASASASQPSTVRRSKRRPLNADAVAYKPEEDEPEGESADDVRISKTKRGKGGQKGTKRSRTMDESASTAPKAKRSKVRKGTSAGDVPGDIVWAHDEMRHLFNGIAEVVRMDSPNRADFLSGFEPGGKYEGTIALYRHNISADRIGVFDQEIVDALAPSVKWIAHNGAGYDQIDVAACKAKGIVVSNTPRAVDDATATTALYLMISALRQFAKAERNLRANNWKYGLSSAVQHDLTGRTLAVLGLGGIGLRLAELAHAFPMRIIYHSRSRNENAPEWCEYFGEDKLDEFLGLADVLSVHVPLKKETEGFVGQEMIRKLKKGAVIVNTARGKVIDEAAVIRALEDEHLGAIGLDVYPDEPAVNPRLLEFSNATLLPHMGTETQDSQRKMEIRALMNIKDYLSKGKGIDVVPELKELAAAL